MKPYYQDDYATLYCGDCREVLPGLGVGCSTCNGTGFVPCPEGGSPYRCSAANCQKSIGGGVRLLWTDPPYGHNNQNGDLQAARVRDGVKGARKRAVEAIENDGQEEMRQVVHDALRLATPLMDRDCCCCCCCCCAGGGGPNVTFAWLANRMDTNGLQFFHACVWDKSGRGHGLGWRFRRNYEFVMVAHRKGGSLAWTDESMAVPNILFFPPTDNELHPTQKPVELVHYFIGLTTSFGELVLDPFAGSGTTLRAAKDMGRKSIGIELNEAYAEIAARRLEQSVLNFGPPEQPAFESPELFA